MVPLSVPAFAQSISDIRHRIDEALASYCALPAPCPPRLAEAVRYSLLGPGKRLRPLLVLFAAEACGSPGERALPAACAVEMIHAYSLVHDDLPAMDDDDLRRGRPTCHKVYGEALAILAGDALLTRAFEVIATDLRPADVAARCTVALAQAAGAAGMVGGQVDDLAAERQTPEGDAGRQLSALESIHRRKTGAMIDVSLRLGALVAGADAAERAALENFGRNLGLAFQIVDDLLDVGGAETTMGKRVGKDGGRGKLTFPGLLGVEESRRRARQLIDDAVAALEPLRPHGEHLEAIARYVIDRDH